MASAGWFGLLASGDRGALPGPGLRYYVLLCDGMGLTGPGAAQEESESALRILTGAFAGRGMPGAEALGTLE